MTLANTLQKKLGEHHSADHPAPHVIRHQGWNVSLRPEAIDTLGCQLWDVTFQREVPQAAGDPRAWAERISRKVTGLLEPLKLVELDAGQNVALVRSAEPTPGSPGLDYHEIELHGTNRAIVRRFRGFQEVGRKREHIPFTVTYDALAKVVDGITAEK
jgi:hypothetical protein